MTNEASLNHYVVAYISRASPSLRSHLSLSPLGILLRDYSAVVYFYFPAEIVVRPNQTIGADNGNTITFVCVAYGIPDPSISWNRGDTTLSNGSRVTIYVEPLTDNGVTFVQSILELCSAEVEDAGQYSCFAENSLGNDTAAFVLTVNGKALA